MPVNKKKLEIKRWESLSQLDFAYKPKLNCLEIDVNNSLRHELAKFVCMWLVRNGVGAEELQKYFRDRRWEEASKKLSSLLRQTGSTTHRPKIVSEARFKDGRRVDIFVLDTGEKIELETGKSYNKKDAIIVKI
jgi:hypothetical protein